MRPIYPRHRRPRECKTCLPCRASKVRCDRKVPCSHCVKRGHPNDCVYSSQLPGSDLTAAALPSSSTGTTPTTTTFSPHAATSSVYAARQFARPPPPQFAQQAQLYVAPPQAVSREADYEQSPQHERDTETISLTQDDWDRICGMVVAMEEIVDSLHTLFRSNKAESSQHDHAPPRQQLPPSLMVETGRNQPSPQQNEGIYEPNATHTSSVHLGPRSIFVDILEKARASNTVASTMVMDDVLADLALGNETAAYPFSDLWSPDPFNFNISGVLGVLPDDQQCRRLVLPLTSF